jgi:wobble nucleotide-excising tRNase
MISKINRIKSLGMVFADFIWTAATPPFRGVNLIYGWNGCGKTTLTRLFDEIASPTSTSIEYELEVQDGTRFSQLDSFPTQVRVFNQDYIGKNVRILESNANAISILLGEQNKELTTQIEADERDLNGDPTDSTKRGKVLELDGYTKKKQRKERDNETAFSDIARTIGAAIAGSSAASRTYRSPDAKRDFATIATPEILSDSDLDVQLLALKQEMLPELQKVELNAVSTDGAVRAALDLAATCFTEAEALCGTTVEAETIARLADNPDIADWIEEGLRLHANHGSESCEYCGNVITKERLSQLARHFSESDRRLKAGIDLALAELRAVFQSVEKLSAYDSARLYQELRGPYDSKINDLNNAKSALLLQITALGKALQDKKARTSEYVQLKMQLDPSALITALSAVNDLIEKHNDKTRGFKALQDSAVKRIKIHYLSTIFEDVTRRIREIAEIEPDLVRRAAEIAEIRARIASARSAISSTHKACEQINSGLRTFLGHKELSFEPETKVVDDESGGKIEMTVGYKIMHGGKPAIYLSEGEKTAIAFVYFVVHLNDGQFQKQNGIVVVDDPVSSLDSNSLYQAFSFLKNAVRDCGQVFVLTHNFDFLKLLLNWRSGARKRDTGFYMIRNHFVGDDRRASIDEMDRELKDYASEYHYLFKRLKEMQAEQNGTIMRAYPVPNMARKVWDAFLLYRVPNGQTSYAKMEQLKTDGFDALKLDAIYKFTNDQSHITGSGFDPALVPETQKVLAELFEMMQAIAPDHYAVLERATQP